MCILSTCLFLSSEIIIFEILTNKFIDIYLYLYDKYYRVNIYKRLILLIIYCCIIVVLIVVNPFCVRYTSKNNIPNEITRRQAWLFSLLANEMHITRG